MLRRLALFTLLLSACAAGPTGEPSLAPRAAETIDPRVPIPDGVEPIDAAGEASPATIVTAG